MGLGFLVFDAILKPKTQDVRPYHFTDLLDWISFANL